MPISVFRRAVAACATAWMTLPGQVQAQTANSVVIWPVNPVIESSDRATPLRLENPGQRPMLMQIRVFGWQQVDGDDRYVEQKDVMATPPMVRIEAGQRQLIRLTRTTPPAGREQAYRVIVDEIPLAPSPAEPSADPAVAGAAIQFRMRYSLPLFVYGDDGGSRSAKDRRVTASALQWRVTGAAGQRVLEIHNGGPVHGRLSQVSLKRADGSLDRLEGVHGYVLPDAVMRWPIPQGIAPQAVLIAASNADEPVPLMPWRP